MRRFLILLGCITAMLVACENPDSAFIGSPDGSPRGNEVAVSLTDFAIEMELSPRAGITTFVVTNDGATEHNFAVVGGVVDTRFEEPLAPGETRTLTTDLDAGTYDVFCPIGDHRQRGMSLSIQAIGTEVVP
jgi:plastocyanin